jgi:hypothetical protein
VIEYAFLGVSAIGTGLVVVAIRYGQGPTDAARRLVDGTGVRRITARQLRHQLRLTEHELAGAGQYIGGLEQDRRELSGTLERVSGELADANTMLVNVARRVVDLEGQVHEMGQLREKNTELRAQLANLTAVRPLPQHCAAQPGLRPIPLQQAPFALGPASTPR